MTKGEVLTPKEAMFCEHYARVDSETYGKKRDSALAAGYKEGSASEMGRRLTNDKQIAMDRIEAIYSENARKHKGRLLSNLEFQRLGAVKAKKWDAANTAVKLQAQLFGFLLADSAIGQGDKEQEKLTEAERNEAQRIANILNFESAKKGKAVEAG